LNVPHVVGDHVNVPVRDTGDDILIDRLVNNISGDGDGFSIFGNDGLWIA
jgi:hypothetical protein